MSATPVRVEVATRLPVAAASVWQGVCHIEWLGYELGPWLRMTTPRGAMRRDWDGNLASVPVGRPLGRSWVLFARVMPVECDVLTLESIEEGRFVEQSRLLSARSWRHERRVEPDGAGCVLTDRLTLVPRLLVPPAVAERVVRRLFEHRHRRLRHRYGGERCPG